MSTRLHRRADDYVKALPVVCRYTVSRNVKPVRGAEIDWDDKAALQSAFQSLGDKEQQCINGRRLSSASQ